MAAVGQLGTQVMQEVELLVYQCIYGVMDRPSMPESRHTPKHEWRIGECGTIALWA